MYRNLGETREERMEAINELARQYREKKSPKTKDLYKNKSYNSILQPMADIAITLGVSSEDASRFVERQQNPNLIIENWISP